uniref:Uncharacterized protein n=1 Tax=Timema douglasi TaxID=61478 RepID=A0A7R8VET1_TIMDO|nr:unnamed protein product [Timema douglasi]
MTEKFVGDSKTTVKEGVTCGKADLGAKPKQNWKLWGFGYGKKKKEKGMDHNTNSRGSQTAEVNMEVEGQLKGERDVPFQVYGTLEEMMRLSRLEEERVLHMALRHVVRLGHEKGDSITFPSPKSLDRIQLRSMNLPTDVDSLRGLIDKVFKKREETFDMENTYRQFVTAHGRKTFNPSLAWPACYAHTYYP